LKLTPIADTTQHAIRETNRTAFSPDECCIYRKAPLPRVGNAPLAKPAIWRAAIKEGERNRKFAPGIFSKEGDRIATEWRAAHPAICKFWYAIDRAA
jgi:hypothetical protein